MCSPQDGELRCQVPLTLPPSSLSPPPSIPPSLSPSLPSSQMDWTSKAVTVVVDVVSQPEGEGVGGDRGRGGEGGGEGRLGGKRGEGGGRRW